MTDPLRPMPMSPEEIADLVERTRAADQAKQPEQVYPTSTGRCRRSRAAYVRRWRTKRAAKS